MLSLASLHVVAGGDSSSGNPAMTKTTLPRSARTFHESGFEGTDEYTPIDADNGDIQQDLPAGANLKTADADEADSSVAENPEWQANTADTVNARVKILRWTS